MLLVPAAGALLARLDLADGFDLGLVPDPALGPGAAMPATALHAGPGDPWILPGRCEDPAAAREMLRQLFSRSWATRYSAVNQLVSVVRDAVPADPRPGLAAQLEALAAAGQQVYSWRFTHCYGTNHDHQALWNAFLEGDMDVATLTRESQRISDLVRADASQRKLPS
ncbi:hypothetical protein [Luteococcus peritonei]|uniref:Uncharacterized protein n=1 Tax=Luteococcus peritonei TaxID=88874 RepID=A0ABW4RUD2_9ACTN